jgi:RNA-directed DNA polymerase
LTLIGRYLRVGVLVNGNMEPTESSVPQGGPLSPLLANIVLAEGGHRFVRYADDFVILLTQSQCGRTCLGGVTRL